jgi:serine/threonine protein kinase
LCAIFDVGQINGVDYLTMPVLSGETLAIRLKREDPLSERSAAQLALLIARAVHIAHKANIIHRDLKPANVMLSQVGEPIVMDFGLARHLASSDIRLTAAGMVLGTPAYIAPEQIGAEPDALHPNCDVYSLGAMLYEMLTGTLPFHGSANEVLRQIEIVLALAADAEVVVAVEDQVAGPGGACPGERGGGGNRGVHKRLGCDANVAEARVTLNRAGRSERLSAVGHDADVDVGVHEPGLKGAEDFGFSRSGRRLGIQHLEQVARCAPGVRSVRNEAQGHIARIWPNGTVRRGR